MKMINLSISFINLLLLTRQYGAAFIPSPSELIPPSLPHHHHHHQQQQQQQHLQRNNQQTTTLNPQSIFRHQNNIFDISPQSISSTRLYKKWSPRWNPKPDSDFYKGIGGNDRDSGLGDYSNIHFGGRRRKSSKYVATFGKTRIFSLQRFLVFLNIAFFLKQIQSSIVYLPILNKLLDQSGYPYELFTKFDLILEQYVLGSSPTIVQGKSFPTLGGSRGRSYGTSLVVASTLGPFTMDFVNQRLLTRIQPHRYLTSGFLHGNLLHLLFNMNYLWKMPRWVENNGGSGNGLSGWCLYLTTYISSIVAGNFARDYFATTSVGMSTLCLGASGGICGLNGLMFAMLHKMENSAASVAVLKNMLFILLFGAMSKGISNASHIGGFVCGSLIGWFFGPNYRKGYSSKRWNFDGNDAPIEYKLAMGPGVEPDKPSLPLKYLLACFFLPFALRPELRVIPEYIWKGFTSPGALSGMYM
jgi:membrane associated rhomboid family serine protease